ncbi:Ribosomal protein S18 [Dillenia turbinata]|uniref:Small ribosomal subunit protein bS18c n=1 Tax=Dillenia turbinata TaxID=194707 RepID=A0AAN8VQ55_9MAGN
MKLIRVMWQSLDNSLPLQFQRPLVVRTLVTNVNLGGGNDENQSGNPFESADDFEQRIFGEAPGASQNLNPFYRKLDKIEKVHKMSGWDSKQDGGDASGFPNDLFGNFNTLSDGMDQKLKQAATYFEYDLEEINKEDYSFRPDMTFLSGMTYDVKDLDLTKPGVRKSYKRAEFSVTTEEVLRKADFRNVRFLAKFLTEAGIIIKRSQTGISAKAQRKVAREIKTARAFGLLPFTTMGTKAFVFGRTMENLEGDYEYTTYDNSSTAPDAEVKS